MSKLERSSAPLHAGAITASIVQLLRLRLGLQQRELAVGLKVGIDTVRSWEGGRRQISESHMNALAELASPDEIASWDAVLHDARLADDLIDRIADRDEEHLSVLDLLVHPFSRRLLHRQQSAMLNWPLTQQTPRHLLVSGSTRQPRHPFLPADVKERFFDHLRNDVVHASETDELDVTASDNVRLVNLARGCLAAIQRRELRFSQRWSRCSPTTRSLHPVFASNSSDYGGC